MLRRVALTASVVLSLSTLALASDSGRRSSTPLPPPRPAAVAQAQQAAIDPSLPLPSDGKSCTAVDRAMAMIESVGGRNFQFLDGDPAHQAADIFNATPPVSRDDWSLVALVDGPDGTGSVIVGNGREVCGRVNFTSDLWPRLVERLLGRRA